MISAETITNVFGYRENEAGVGVHADALITQRSINYYEDLLVDRFASSSEVEKAFLKRVRSLLRTSGGHGGGLSVSEKSDLMSLCVARDVLINPPSREEHDFHFLSLRRKTARQTRLMCQSLEEIGTGRVEIVESLQLTELVSPQEIQIALELHNPLALEPFGKYLVDSGTVDSENLEAALLGRLLFKDGRLRKTSLQRIFKAMRSFGVDFVDSILVTIDISAEELLGLAKMLKLEILPNTISKKIEGNSN